MRIGIIADAHLFGRWSQPQLYRNTLQKLQNEHKVDIIVDCGDVTDNSIINSENSNVLYDIFKSIDIPMHIVRGNHDSLGGCSLASVLKINKNIIVHNSVEICDNMLFIPYINSKTQLKNDLDNLSLTEPAQLAFSHITMTENPYAMLTFNNNEASKFMHKYANTIFNGHIHNYSECKSLYGIIYNIGSFSNQSFGDEDIPHYFIYDTEKDELSKYIVVGGIMHKTICINNIDDVDTIISLPNAHNILFNWRVKLPADFDFNMRNQIKEKLYQYKYTNNVQFDYITKRNNQKVAETLNVEKSKTNSKISLLDQLFNSFEQQSGQKLDDKIKQELKD